LARRRPSRVSSRAFCAPMFPSGVERVGLIVLCLDMTLQRIVFRLPNLATQATRWVSQSLQACSVACPCAMRLLERISPRWIPRMSTCCRHWSTLPSCEPRRYWDVHRRSELAPWGAARGLATNKTRVRATGPLRVRLPWSLWSDSCRSSTPCPRHRDTPSENQGGSAKLHLAREPRGRRSRFRTTIVSYWYWQEFAFSLWIRG